MRRILAALVLAASVAAAAPGQDAPARVPRPVYFPPAALGAALDEEGASLIAGTPEMLATSIAALQPIAHVDSADQARSVVTVTASPSSAGRLVVTIRLLEEDVAKAENARAFSAPSLDLAAFRAFVIETASRFAPALGPVAPRADVLKITSQEELIRTDRQTDPLDRLDKRWEFTLLASGLLRLLDSTGAETNSTARFGLGVLPLIAEASWFFKRNLGVQLSFYFNYSNAFDFGNGSRHDAYGLFLFPGIGLVYRTLGEISAEYAITLSGGWVRVTAESADVVDQESTVVIPEGSTVWSSLAARIRISPAVVWSITPSIALKAAFGFDFIFPGMFSWYDSPLADMQYLSIGAAYRM